MIHLWCNRALVILADGRVLNRRLDDGDGPTEWTNIECLNGSVIKEAGVGNVMFPALTSDERILICFDTRHTPLDITPKVYEVFGRTASIKDIRLRGHTLIVWTNDSIGLFEIKNKSVIGGRVLYRHPCEIDIQSIGSRWGLAKGIDGALVWYCDRRGLGEIQIEPAAINWQVQPIDFHERGRISKIFCIYFEMLLLMDDGRVYVRQDPVRTRWGPRVNPEPSQFRQVIFPDGECVIKIVITVADIFYITAAGSCYHAVNGMSADWEMKPALLEFLSGYLVERIYSIGFDFVIQYGGNRLCVLYVSRPLDDDGRPIGYGDRRNAFDSYTNGTKIPRLLPFLDNKAIVLIKTLFDRIYFVTDEGHAFWTTDMGEQIEPVITRDTFFDANPIAVKRNACSIRSARSLLDDA